MMKATIPLLAALVLFTVAAQSAEIAVKSPDRKVVVEVTDNGGLSYSVSLDDRQVVRSSRDDETPTIDPNNLQLLVQGRDPAINASYSQLPYRLGLLRLNSSAMNRRTQLHLQTDVSPTLLNHVFLQT
jgi:hypothetical protein